MLFSVEKPAAESSLMVSLETAIEAAEQLQHWSVVEQLCALYCLLNEIDFDLDTRIEIDEVQ